MARLATALLLLSLAACGARSDLRAPELADSAPDAEPDLLAADVLSPVLPDVAPWPDTGRCGHDALIAASFVRCEAGGFVGQTKDAPGVTCAQVCCVFGFAGCSYRTAQADYNYCVPKNPAKAGECEDVYWPSWSSGCACAP